MCNLRISVYSLYALHPQFWNIFNNSNRDRKYSTFTSVIPKWNSLQFGIYAFQYEIFAKYTVVKSLCIYCVIIVCMYSQILTENIGPSHFIPKWTNHPIRNIDKVRIIAISLYTLYHILWK